MVTGRSWTSSDSLLESNRNHLTIFGRIIFLPLDLCQGISTYSFWHTHVCASTTSAVWKNHKKTTSATRKISYELQTDSFCSACKSNDLLDIFRRQKNKNNFKNFGRLRAFVSFEIFRFTSSPSPKRKSHSNWTGDNQYLWFTIKKKRRKYSNETTWVK